jgi:hypothetical protein
MGDLDSAFGFAVHRAIESGLLDDFLDKIISDARWRKGLLDPSKPPRKTADMRHSGHQVWAWMGGADPPQWEIVGTGLVLTEEQLAEHVARRERLIKEQR